MKKVLTTLLISLVSPLIAFAAFDSVQLSTGSTLVLSVGGSNLEFTVTNGNIQDVEVAGANVIFTLAAGSTVSISSADRKKLDHSSLNRIQASFSCSSSSSSIGLSLSAGASDEGVTVTPSSATCTTPSEGTAASGSTQPAVQVETPAPASSPVPTLTPTPTPVPALVVAQAPAVEVAKPSTVAKLVSPVFNKDWQPGSKGDDVRRLQELLKTDKGIYPDGLVTGYYGALTKVAVVKFQLKYGVIKSANDQGAGRFGPKTRAKFQEVFGAAAPVVPVPAYAPAETSAPSANKNLQDQINILLKQVQELQVKLKKP